MNKPTKGIAADASCRGNPGPIEWKVVDLETAELLYETKVPYEGGTNNIAEFLAIVHALAQTDGSDMPVYSDSQTARVWVKRGFCSMESCRSEILRKVIIRANTWLKEHPLASARVECWQTKLWGETPADFNRKRK